AIDRCASKQTAIAITRTVCSAIAKECRKSPSTTLSSSNDWPRQRRADSSAIPTAGTMPAPSSRTMWANPSGAAAHHPRIVPRTSARRQRESHASRDDTESPGWGKTAGRTSTERRVECARRDETVDSEGAAHYGYQFFLQRCVPGGVVLARTARRERERFRRAKDCADCSQPPGRIVAAAPRQSGGQPGHDAGPIN